MITIVLPFFISIFLYKENLKLSFITDNVMVYIPFYVFKQSYVGIRHDGCLSEYIIYCKGSIFKGECNKC